MPKTSDLAPTGRNNKMGSHTADFIISYCYLDYCSFRLKFLLFINFQNVHMFNLGDWLFSHIAAVPDPRATLVVLFVNLHVLGAGRGIYSCYFSLTDWRKTEGGGGIFTILKSIEETRNFDRFCFFFKLPCFNE